MKRITLSLTMAMSCLMTTQSFGFDLLDRMLGSKGCGCDTQCCDTPVVAGPGCGCEAPSAGCGLLGGLKGCAAPACGCEAPACGCEAPACGCEAPACGCEVAACDGCDAGSCLPKPGGLLKKLFGKVGCKDGCDSACGCAEPACGLEPTCGCAEPACGCGEVAACDSCGLGGCKIKRPGLLSKLFGGLRHSSCDECCDAAPSCGCGETQVVPMSTPANVEVPAAPAPIVDPSASIKTKSRVVQASARYVH